MKKSIVSAFSVICFVPTMIITVGAEPMDNNIAVPYSTGLINSYKLSISSTEKDIFLSADTCSNRSMKSIGIKSIEIQISSDNINWSDYLSVDDMLSSNVSSSAISKNIATVSGGYYYRVTCNHYAKESGLFGSSESISNTSNSIYIPE